MDKYYPKPEGLFNQSSKPFIYIPYENSYNLWRFNCTTHCFKLINLRHSLPHRFKNTSLCLIPPNSIFIFSRDSSLNTSFILNTTTLSCTVLPHPMYLRTEPSILYHQNRIYVIGGRQGPKPCKLASYYDLNTNRWISLPNLIYPHSYCSSIGIHNQVFVIGSWVNSSIEIYNTKTNILHTTDLFLPLYGNISTVYNDRIYIFTSIEILILSSSLQILNRIPSRDKKKVTYTNIVTNKDHIYTVNSWYFHIELTNLLSLTSSSIPIPEICFS